MTIDINSVTVIDNNRIFKPANYSESITSPAISSGTLTLNLQSGSVFNVNLNSDINTITLQNSPSTSSSSASFLLLFTADGTSRAVTWPNNFRWPGGIAPTLTSTNGKTDVFAFFTPDNGTSWLAFTSGQNF